VVTCWYDAAAVGGAAAARAYAKAVVDEECGLHDNACEMGTFEFEERVNPESEK
jgi:hypothetical protein